MARFDVFISHSAKDKDFVRRLRTDLEVYGYQVWLDETYLTIGNGLSSALEQAIRDSRFVAAVRSRSSATSPWVEQECQFAASVGVPVIPVVLDRDSLDDDTAARFYADFTGPDDQHAYHRAFHDVLNVLGTTSGQRGDLCVYSQGLSRGWLNSSWDARCMERCRIDDSQGLCCFRADLRPFGGVAFVFRSGISTAPFSYFRFSLHGGETGGHKMKVYLNDRIGNGMLNQVPLDPLPGAIWTPFSVSLAELDAEHTVVFKVNWSHAHGDLSGPIYVAEVWFTRNAA